MSYTYYGVEPYTGNIICHTGREGMRWGYSNGELVDRNKVAKEKRIEYLQSNWLNRWADDLNRNRNTYGIDYEDPKIAKELKMLGYNQPTKDFIKKMVNSGRALPTARNLDAKAARIDYLNKRPFTGAAAASNYINYRYPDDRSNMMAKEARVNYLDKLKWYKDKLK